MAAIIGAMEAPNDVDLIRELLDRQPVEAMQALAPKFAPSARRTRRLDDRDAAYRDFAAGEGVTSGYAITKAIRSELKLYRDGGSDSFSGTRGEGGAMRKPEHRRAADRHGLRYPSDLTEARRGRSQLRAAPSTQFRRLAAPGRKS